LEAFWKPMRDTTLGDTRKTITLPTAQNGEQKTVGAVTYVQSRTFLLLKEFLSSAYKKNPIIR